MKLQPVHVRDVWDQIKGAVAEILQGEDERPEDVYAALVHGEAHLYRSDEGFIVLRAVKNSYTRRVDLVVWLAQSFVFGVNREAYQRELERLAQVAGASRIIFHTQRNGWEKVLDERWLKKRVTFQMEIPS